MDILKLDAHFFVKDMAAPEKSDIPMLIDLFSEFDLMPQYFDEQNVSTKEVKKRLSFVNPEARKAVYFKSDKVLISSGYDPFSQPGENLDASFEEFLNFSRKVLEQCVAFLGDKVLSHRVSIVSDFFQSIDGELHETKLSRGVEEVINWCDAPVTEMKVRTAEIGELNSGEEINAVVAVNDGYLEQSANGVYKKKRCYLTQLDLNTKSQNEQPRFNVEETLESWQELLVKTKEKAAKIELIL